MGVFRQVSCSDRADSSVASSSLSRVCAWCRGGLAVTVRKHARTCSQSCRQALHRFERGAVARGRASQLMRFAYADPPYPGKAFYYRGHVDFRGEVDHAALLSRLEGFDGWALSTSSDALPFVLSLCVARRLTVRVAAWVRGARSVVSAGPLQSWEPVIFAGGRQQVSRGSRVDSFSYVSRPRLTDVDRVIGAKPAAFCYWVFELLGACQGDSLDDLFPGSGGVSRAWSAFQRVSASSVQGVAVAGL